MRVLGNGSGKMLEIRRLDKRFADKTVADGIDLRVDAGCLTAVLGASANPRC